MANPHPFAILNRGVVRGQRLGQGDSDVRLVTGQDLFAAELVPVSDDLQRIRFQRCLRLVRHGRQLRPVVTLVDDVVGDDQVMGGVDRGLHIIADHA